MDEYNHNTEKRLPEKIKSVSASGHCFISTRDLGPPSDITNIELDGTNDRSDILTVHSEKDPRTHLRNRKARKRKSMSALLSSPCPGDSLSLESIEPFSQEDRGCRVDEVAKTTENIEPTSEMYPAYRMGQELSGDQEREADSKISKVLHFLIVDDVVMNRRMVRRVLSSSCQLISEATDGRDCLKVWEEITSTGGTVDVVLMDSSMPIMTGERN